MVLRDPTKLARGHRPYGSRDVGAHHEMLKSESHLDTSEVLAVVDRAGVLFSGQHDAVEKVVTQLTEGPGTRTIRVASGLGAVAVSTQTIAATGEEYVRLSAASRQLLAQHGAIPGDNGYFRMFVHDSAKRIAGQLQWQHVTLVPEQALSLQVSAVSLALRAAIYEVQQSLERVEAKLDHITRLMQSERLGDALGDHRTLTGLVARVHAGREITAADWMTVAAMGPEIVRSLERLRAHIRLLLKLEEPGRLPWTRAERAQQVIEEGWIEESLALLTVVINNLAMWHQIRLAHIAHDSSDLVEILDELDREIESQRESDQLILDLLVAFTARIADPRAYDGLDPLSAQRLFRQREELDHLAEWFAAQRCLDIDSNVSKTFPSFWESAQHVAGMAADNAAWLAGKVRALVTRTASLETTALPSGVEESESPDK